MLDTFQSLFYEKSLWLREMLSIEFCTKKKMRRRAMANILILGAGVMGSAFSIPLVDAGHAVYLVGTHLDQEWIESIRNTRIHPKLKTNIPETVIPLTHEQLDEALRSTIDLIVLGVSSAGVDWAIQQLGSRLPRPIPVLMLTKGLAARANTLEILPHLVRDGLAAYGLSNVSVGAVGGPCIARELAARRDSSVVVAFSDMIRLHWILSLLITPYYHVHPNPDLQGVEACAALKNFYALAIGYPAGLSEKQGNASNGACMYNLAAGLFTQSLAEMSHLVEFMGGTRTSVYGLAGTGDLYVTCQAGRNNRMGHLLGMGFTYRDAKTSYMAEDTVEGAELALAIGPTLEALCEQDSLDRSSVPLAMAIIEAICYDHPLNIPWNAFYHIPNRAALGDPL
jgi:glycerol-3-phosphate dehydrogenase (NAD(P)+)